MAEYRLEMKGICKSFPGVKALDGINLRVRPGTVHALMGENGAGKSTLMKCLFGIYKMDEGEIYLDGEKMTILNPDDALHKGLAMVHQELQPIPERTIAENMYLGRYPLLRKAYERSCIHENQEYRTLLPIIAGGFRIMLFSWQSRTVLTGQRGPGGRRISDCAGAMPWIITAGSCTSILNSSSICSISFTASGTS